MHIKKCIRKDEFPKQSVLDLTVLRSKREQLIDHPALFQNINDHRQCAVQNKAQDSDSCCFPARKRVEKQDHRNPADRKKERPLYISFHALPYFKVFHQYPPLKAKFCILT